MAKVGRPRKKISKEQFEKLCVMQCTEAEMCGFFGVTDKTLSKWCKENYGGNFSDTYKIYSQDGKISLRRQQFRVANSGNVSMLIWLGKQYLGQKEFAEVSVQENIDDSVKEMEKYLASRKKRDT